MVFCITERRRRPYSRPASLRYCPKEPTNRGSPVAALTSDSPRARSPHKVKVKVMKDISICASNATVMF